MDSRVIRKASAATSDAFETIRVFGSFAFFMLSSSTGFVRCWPIRSPCNVGEVESAADCIDFNGKQRVCKIDRP